jgi:hypothetical protein
MKVSLERKIERALQDAIEKREWQGLPFTVGDICNDLQPLMDTPEVRDAIAIDRIAEMLEEERMRTGIVPTIEDAKRLLQREALRVKLSESELQAKLAVIVSRRLDEADIN